MKKKLITTLSILAFVFAIWAIFSGRGFNKVLPPWPVIVSSKWDADNSNVLDYVQTARAVIRNDGGDGDVVITFNYDEDGQAYVKTLRRHFGANETADVMMQFTEAKLMAKVRTFNVTAK